MCYAQSRSRPGSAKNAGPAHRPGRMRCQRDATPEFRPPLVPMEPSECRGPELVGYGVPVGVGRYVAMLPLDRECVFLTHPPDVNFRFSVVRSARGGRLPKIRTPLTSWSTSASNVCTSSDSARSGGNSPRPRGSCRADPRRRPRPTCRPISPPSSDGCRARGGRPGGVVGGAPRDRRPSFHWPPRISHCGSCPHHAVWLTPDLDRGTSADARSSALIPWICLSSSAPAP